MKTIRMLITGGGSGGHIYPMIAVVQELRKLAGISGDRLDIRYFGQPERYAAELAGSGIPVIRVAGSKFRRYVSILNIIDFIKFAWSIPQALWKVFWFMPDVAFSKGGPGAFAVLNACVFYHIPTVIHDSDAIPGLTSRITGKTARLIELSFPGAAAYFEGQRERVRIPGNPARTELSISETERTALTSGDAKIRLNMTPELPLLLVLGGSQGAVTLNTFILENLPLLLDRYQVLHQVGITNYEAYKASAEGTVLPSLARDARRRYRYIPFFTGDMRTAMIAADLVISRAGAGAIFEIAAAGKPSILVPIANSANEHQRENAFQYNAAGACLVIEEENLIGNLVLAEIDGLFNNPEKLKKMSMNATTFSRPDAANAIAKDILSLI